MTVGGISKREANVRAHRTAALVALRQREAERAVTGMVGIAKDQEADASDSLVGHGMAPLDDRADELPGLRAAVVARGKDLMASWGMGAGVLTLVKSGPAMQAEDYAAMSVRLAGTARGSSYAFFGGG